MAGVASKLMFRLPTKTITSMTTTTPLGGLVSFPAAASFQFAGRKTLKTLLFPTTTTTTPFYHDRSPTSSRSLQTDSSSSSSDAAAPPPSPPFTRVTKASITLRHNLPVLLLQLPSRRDEAGCEFIIRPSSSTVEELVGDIQREDHGVESIFVTVNGVRVAKKTAMQHLLTTGFDLHMNDLVHAVPPMALDHVPIEYEAMTQSEAEEMKDLVKNLYAVLNMRPHLLEQSKQLRAMIEDNRLELSDLERQLDSITKNTEKKLVSFNLFNLFLMSFQFGMFARLTWWEYSWDIMEPVTYFTTTFHAMVLVYGWSVLTRKDLLYPVAADHFYLKWLYKLCGKHEFDIERYNALKTKIHEDESILKRIRTPLETNFWIAPPKE